MNVVRNILGPVKDTKSKGGVRETIHRVLSDDKEHTAREIEDEVRKEDYVQFWKNKEIFAKERTYEELHKMSDSHYGEPSIVKIEGKPNKYIRRY